MSSALLQPYQLPSKHGDEYRVLLTVCSAAVMGYQFASKSLQMALQLCPQYALAKMATSVASAPVKKHVPGPCGCSKGMQRRVAVVSSLIRFSSSSDPALQHHAHHDMLY